MFSTFLSVIINDIQTIKPSTLVILSSLTKSHLDYTLITQSNAFSISKTLSIL